MDGVPTTNSGSTTVLQCHPVSPSRPVSAMPGRKIATARTNFSAATEKNTISTIRGWCPGARHHVSGSNGKNSIFLSTAAAAVSICWLADTPTNADYTAAGSSQIKLFRGEDRLVMHERVVPTAGLWRFRAICATAGDPHELVVAMCADDFAIFL